ncbi:hypothetical protein D3871_26325 [Noviherbaspirillum saxi]|uniref:Uncharacterized protein n=1 Tax=Noviherbaspirillum saxi TaxID=2320863 RepID=A0A3A3FFP7_9BURK|nr:hypothetical protein D3871_26325 [Noviherbaspirillum saxi]
MQPISPLKEGSDDLQEKPDSTAKVLHLSDDMSPNHPRSRLIDALLSALHSIKSAADSLMNGVNSGIRY